VDSTSTTYGATTKMLASDASCNFHIELWQIDVNGTTAVTVYPHMRQILTVQATWAEDIGATGHVIEATVDNDVTNGRITPSIAVTASGAITKVAYLTVYGY